MRKVKVPYAIIDKGTGKVYEYKAPHQPSFWGSYESIDGPGIMGSGFLGICDACQHKDMTRMVKACYECGLACNFKLKAGYIPVYRNKYKI